MDAAVAFIVLLLLFLAVEYLITVIARKILRETENFDYYLFLCVSTFIIQGLVFAVAFVFCKIRRVNVFDGGGFVYKFDIVKILFALILTSGIFFVVSHAHYVFIEDVFDVLYGRSYAEYTEELEKVYQGNTAFALLYVYVLTPLLPCVCEEVMFRGVVMRGFRQFGVAASVILSSICFTFMHGNVEQIVLQFCIGLAIAAVVSVTKNFLIGAAMHFSNNFFNSVYSVTENFLGSIAIGGEKLAEALFIVTGVVFIVIGGFYFFKLAIKENVKNATGAVVKIPYFEKDLYAVIRRAGEEAQILYPVQTEFSLINDGTFYFEKNGKELRVNKRSNKTISIVVTAVAIAFSVALIFLF